MSAPTPAPAGFWRRYAAWSLDWLLLGAVLALALAPLVARALAQWRALQNLLDDWVLARMEAAGGFVSPVALALELLDDRRASGALQAAMLRLDATLALLLAIVLATGALYFVGFEASPWRATPGKRLVRLQVADLAGARLPFARVLARHLAGALGWMLLNLGHALAGWRRDHRALHDLVAGAQVLAHGALPAWARAWLMAQAGLLVAVLVGIVLWFAWIVWQLSSLL